LQGEKSLRLFPKRKERKGKEVEQVEKKRKKTRKEKVVQAGAGGKGKMRGKRVAGSCQGEKLPVRK